MAEQVRASDILGLYIDLNRRLEKAASNPESSALHGLVEDTRKLFDDTVDAYIGQQIEATIKRIDPAFVVDHT